MIKKSLNDKNIYFHYFLKNHIEVLLIKNELFKNCSISLSVGVGSFDENRDIQGIAHFLEHMLFLGSKKFPDEKALSDFCNQNGGHTNAFTSDEETVYFCSSDVKKLPELSEIFRNMFISPLFNEASVSREINAVNSEFLNLKNDNYFIRMAVLKELILKERSDSLFDIGNTESLNYENLHKVVFDFYKEKYSSHKMKLVICGNQEIEYLKEISKGYEEIPLNKDINNNNKDIDINNKDIDINNKDNNKDIDINNKDIDINNNKDINNKDIDNKDINNKDINNKDIDINEIIFNNKFLNKLIFFESSDLTKAILISLNVPSTLKYYKTNPFEYFKSFLLKKNNQSLIYYYQKHNLAYDINCYDNTNKNYTLITIEIILTNNGLLNFNKVINLLIDYIKTIKADFHSYKRLSQIRNTQFKYLSSECPVDLSFDSSYNLLRYPYKYIYAHNYTLENFDKNFINQYLNLIKNYKSWIILIKQKNFNFNKVVKHFNINYSIGNTFKYNKEYEFNNNKDININNKDIDINKDININNNNKVLNNIHIIKKEEILIEKKNFNLINDLQNENKKNQYIHKTIENKNKKLIYIFEDNFNLPKCKVNIILNNKKYKENFLYFNLFFKIYIKIFLKKYEELLENFHIDFEIKLREANLKVEFSGFNTKMTEIISLFFNEIKNINFNFFDISKEELFDEFYKIIFSSPFYRLKKTFIKGILGMKSTEKEIEKLKKIKKEKIIDLDVIENSYIEIIAVGNIYYSDVYNLYESLKNKGEKFSYKLNFNKKKFKFKNKDKNNNAVMLTYRLDQNIKNMEIIRLIKTIFNEMFFYELRTQEQLGYIVKLQNESFYKNEFLNFIVQSEKDCKFLKKRIKSFIKSISKKIKKMSDDEFKVYKKSLINSYKEPFINLDEFSDFLINQHFNYKIDFDFIHKIIKEIKNIKKEDILLSNIFNNNFIIKSINKT